MKSKLLNISHYNIISHQYIDNSYMCHKVGRDQYKGCGSSIDNGSKHDIYAMCMK